MSTLDALDRPSNSGPPASSGPPAAPPPASPQSRRHRWRNARVWIALAGALVLIAVTVGPPPAPGEPLDPRSTSPSGAKAFVLLLEHYGATVDFTTGLPAPGADVAVVLGDRLDRGRRDGLRSWVATGGTLLVADPLSDLQSNAIVRVAKGLSPQRFVDGPCPRFGLNDVGRLDTGGSFYLRRTIAARSCFPAGDAASFLTETPFGSGTIVGLGGAGVFTNDLIGHNDNSVLAVDLLAPAGGRRVAIMLPSVVGQGPGGRRSLWALVASPVKRALAQLFVAFIVFALWRARRLGQPVPEDQLVDVPGSELVVAGGDLMARAGSREAAAAILRDGMRKWLATRLGLGPGATIEEVGNAVAGRTSVDGERLYSLLVNRPPATDADLVILAQSIEHVRQEVSSDRQ